MVDADDGSDTLDNIARDSADLKVVSETTKKKARSLKSGLIKPMH